MRILLVEDHSDSADMFLRLLEGAGYAVTCVEGAVDAARLCDERPFDLLICDIGLPDGDGWSLMRQLHAAHGIRGIALSAHAYPADEQRSREAGFCEHVTKPVSFETLLAAIHRASGGSSGNGDTLPDTSADVSDAAASGRTTSTGQSPRRGDRTPQQSRTRD